MRRGGKEGCTPKRVEDRRVRSTAYSHPVLQLTLSNPAPLLPFPFPCRRSSPAPVAARTMPMRIISKGRHAYLLAGYLLKRGKLLWQWSERYFVLTPEALHYFKRDRRELYGE